MATLLIMALQEESQGLFEGRQFAPFYCGVGLIKAAFWTHKLILEKKPTRVVNLGTAGSHKLAPGTLIECTSFIQRPANDFLPPSSKKISVAPITGLATGVCGSGDFIDFDKCLVECDVMDMEAYAMAYVCQQLHVPFTSVKYISDASGTDTIEQWKQNVKLGAEQLVEVYQKIISEDIK